MTARLTALAILDIAWWCVCTFGGVAAGWALAGHAALSGFGFATWLRGEHHLSFAAAVVGVFGPLGILATLPFARRSRPSALRSDEAMFGPPARRIGQRGATLAAARMLDGRVHHAGPETLTSLMAILRHGDVSARRRALETVVRSFEPRLSPLIALALTDRDQTIRALAAAASSRVAQNLLSTRATLAERTDPEAAAVLATLLADHARADVLLSDSQRGHLLDDAVALMPADDAGHRSLTFESLWAAGDYAAIDTLVDAIAVDPKAERADVVRLATWWRAGAAA